MYLGPDADNVGIGGAAVTVEPRRRRLVGSDQRIAYWSQTEDNRPRSCSIPQLFKVDIGTEVAVTLNDSFLHNLHSAVGWLPFTGGGDSRWFHITANRQSQKGGGTLVPILLLRKSMMLSATSPHLLTSSSRLRRRSSSPHSSEPTRKRRQGQAKLHQKHFFKTNVGTEVALLLNDLFFCNFDLSISWLPPAGRKVWKVLRRRSPFILVDAFYSAPNDVSSKRRAASVPMSIFRESVMMKLQSNLVNIFCSTSKS